MEQQVIASLEEISRRIDEYEKYHQPAVWITVGAVLSAIAIMLWGGKDGDPQFCSKRGS